MELIKSLILTEFYTCSGYLEKLIFAFTELEKLHLSPRGKNQLQKLLNDINLFFEKQFVEIERTEETNWDSYKTKIKACNNFIESMIKLPYSSKQFEKISMAYINLLYRNCYEIHNMLLESTELDIQFPKSGFIKEENIPTISQAELEFRAPLFYVDEFGLNQYVIEAQNHSSPNQSSLSFLQIKREEKHDQFLHKGHFCITQKNYEGAKQNFTKARNYKETAEVLTLLAWSYSLLEDKKEAKSYCLRAISIDSQYGPAYNDYGNYILAEGHLKESLRWFELAKRAHNYQNREYPYINAGRAYVLLKDYEQALTEFSLALTIAPHHHELHDTVAKLKTSLEKKFPLYSDNEINNKTTFDSFENN